MIRIRFFISVLYVLPEFEIGDVAEELIIVLNITQEYEIISNSELLKNIVNSL